MITSSPYKSNLLKSVEVVTAGKNKKEVAAKCSRQIVGGGGGGKPLPNALNCKRKFVDSSSSDESDDVFSIVSDSSGEEDNDAECLFCGCVFSDDKHGEQWIQCTVCYR
ncbi:hypothetical protein PR048_003792 [Dryococelus australis]|uniref:Uncharacterized protein n=1 Tax=Dryococelus australis TaxID=614101 RepID=A0ABQ9IPK3_9NEOP|nr:hypothetical protein PR048_003792 [Dryococelus australis]